MNTPVLFLIFNRPDVTRKVFDAIRDAKPSRLYVAADGPRKSRPAEAVLCLEVRSIVENIDWPCEVFTKFRDENLGCKAAVSSAIDWFFEHEERGIVLEDDCLPHPTFFAFCEAMLDRYQHDTRISHIGGGNFQEGTVRGDGDYYYSRLTHVWGWASWRRAWKNYDIHMRRWEAFKKTNNLARLFPDQDAHALLVYAFDQVSKGLIDTWDYQLSFSNIANGGLSIIPNVNLITNIGFSAQATHTVGEHPYGSLASFPLITHRKPSFFLPCVDADIYTLRKEAGKKGVVAKMRGIVKRLLKRVGIIN